MTKYASERNSTRNSNDVNIRHATKHRKMRRRTTTQTYTVRDLIGVFKATTARNNDGMSYLH